LFFPIAEVIKENADDEGSNEDKDLIVVPSS
jgi:hypothetical protein